MRETKGGRKLALTKVTDNIEEIHGVHLPYPPYTKDRFSGRLKLNGDYGDIEGLEVGSVHLDPFERFRYDLISARESIL
jgi:hypothetical protein